MSLLTLLSFLTLFNIGLKQTNNNLHVTIENIKDPQGQLIVALFDSKETFLVTPFKSLIIETNETVQTLTFEDLPEGNYSVSIIYDRNGNGELDKNFFGVPTEGFGFSKKSIGIFGPPSYNDTKVEIKNGDVSVTIPLKYM